MKILQILPELNVGGVERGTVDFARYLVEKDYQSVVVSNGGTLVKQLEREGSKHLELPVHKKSLFSVMKLIKVLRKIIIDEKIDIVHARSRVPAWIAYFATRQTSARFITTCHGYYKSHFFSQVMGWAKYIIAPSKVIGRHMIDDYDVESETIRYIPRSVDLENFKRREQHKSKGSERIVAMVGRITPLKGHIYFIKAMAQVIRAVPNTVVWIIGDAPEKKQGYKQELEVLIRRMGLAANIKFLGNRSDVHELLRKVDVLVMSSITPEAFGRVILEAQAVGVPVVATSVGGVVDIIDDKKTGLLVLPKDPEGMAAAVLQLFKDEKLVESLVDAAYTKIENYFTLEHMASQTVEVYKELMNSENILVIKLSSIGDVILISASLKALRKKYPEAKIYCLVGRASRHILKNCPYLDGLIVYDPTHDGKDIFSLWKFARRFRKRYFDKVIDFQNNRRSHLLSFYAMAKESFGFDNGKWSFLLSRPLKKYKNNIPAVAHQFQLLKMLGIKNNAQTLLQVWPTKSDEDYVKQLFDEEWLSNAKNIVGINISASAKWESKNWPLEHMAKLCDMLSSKNIRVVITGMEKDKYLVHRLFRLTKAKPTDFVGKTNIMQLAVVIKRCKAFITPDSAPLHLAAAVGTPAIALFGPTSSKRHLPPGKNINVLERDVKCAPCYSQTCKIGTHICMKELFPEEVSQLTTEIIGEIKV